MGNISSNGSKADCYKDGKFEIADTLFTNLIDKYDDNPSKYFLSLVKDKHPWGVHRMTTK